MTSPLPVIYKGVQIDCSYRLDIVAEELVIIEIKAIDVLLPVHEAQLLTYLKLSGMRVGLLTNFHESVLKDGIRRRVL
jgi:GxxExxY protein